MKKLFVAIILSLVVFSSAASFLLFPQRSEAYMGVGDIVFDLTAEKNALIAQLDRARQFVLDTKEYVTETLQLDKLIESAKTAAEIYGVGKDTYDFFTQKSYGAQVKTILGFAGLGSLSPVMDKFLNGVGLKDILVDEVGGALGLGGILQGGLQGIFTQEDTISSLMGQMGIKIPSGTLAKLKDLGIFSPDGIMRSITCGSGSGSNAPKPPPTNCDSLVTPDINECVDKPTTRGPDWQKAADNAVIGPAVHYRWCVSITSAEGAPINQCADDEATCNQIKSSISSTSTVSGCTKTTVPSGQNSTGVQGAQTGPAGGDVLADTAGPEFKIEKETARHYQWCFTYKTPDGKQQPPNCSLYEAQCKEKVPIFKAGGNTAVTDCAQVFDDQASTGNTQPSGSTCVDSLVTPNIDECAGKSSTGGSTPASGGSSGSCSNPGGVASDPKVIDQVKGVLQKFGLTGLDDNTIAKLVDQGIVDVETAKQYVAPPPPPKPAKIINPSPPCVEWLETGGCKKIRTSFSDNADDTKDIPTDPAQFILRFFTIVLGLAGGIALLLMIFAGYKLITSSGKPEGIQQGREQLVSAIVGLIFIIFSFVIFQLIVVDILKIPGVCKDPNDPKCQPSAASQSQPPQPQWCDRIINGEKKIVPCSDAVVPGQDQPDPNGNWVQVPDPNGGTCYDNTKTDAKECVPEGAQPKPKPAQPAKPAGGNWVQKPDPSGAGGTCWDNNDTPKQECEVNRPQQPAQPAQPAGGDNWVEDNKDSQGVTCWDNKATPEKECRSDPPEKKSNWVKDNKDSQGVACWDDKSTPEKECRGENPDAGFFDMFPLF